MQKLKILFVSEYYPPVIAGGGELSAEILTSSLADKGHTIHVLISYFSGLKTSDTKNKVRIFRLLKTGLPTRTIAESMKRSLLFTASVKKHAAILDKTENYDIIHCLNNTSTAGISKIKTDAKLVATLNSYVNLCPKANLFYMEKEVCSGCAPMKFFKCITHSEYAGLQRIPFLLRYNPVFWKFLYFTYLTRKNSLKKFNVLCRSKFISDFAEKNNLTEKRTGIEYSLFSPEKKTAVHENIKSITKNKEAILCIGTLEKIKGIDILIRSYAKVKEKKNSMLLIVGDGSKKQEYRELAELLGIGGRVYFAGNVEQKYISYLYKLSSVVAMAPLWPEPFSRVMLEALYFGKSIIATDVGGNPDGIEDGKNGFLVSDDINDIAEKLEKLISSKSLQDKMGKKSNKLFKKLFAKEKIINSMLEFYKILDQ